MKQRTILVVEQTATVRQSIRRALKDKGFRIIEESYGDKVTALLQRYSPALLLMDVQLPWIGQELSTMELCQSLRQRSELPIILLSSSDSVEELSQAIDCGADAYIRLPFDERELRARVIAVLRRTAAVDCELAPIIDFPKLHIDTKRSQIMVDGQFKALSNLQQKLFAFLAMHPNVTLSRDEIVKGVWGFDCLDKGRIVDAHIKNLRRRLKVEANCPWDIVTEWGKGYRFALK